MFNFKKKCKELLFESLEFHYINAKYLSINKNAKKKAINIVFTKILQDVSHLVPIHFVGSDDNDYVCKNAVGCFTSIKPAYEIKYKPKHIGILMRKEEDFDSMVMTLLHEVGHFNYINYGRRPSLKLNSPSIPNYDEYLADLFIIDYIDTLPLWIQSALSSWRDVYAHKLEKVGFNVKEIEFDGKEVYEDLKKYNLEYLAYGEN